ncbi:GlsB/YeaQ/YmgE family stress response membrane protein [Gemmobacter caeruleus]|uniref:GlsB/YeaQ/YmgE family stress response membrane protein n=1 Tax=Gemmobacter caeruleus TaxID=2595004 RepID=UPI0011EFD358|nr:GlsB/YeaQ/YmgE family stress response membrane protein [Gemmobacter caeruleus]
MTFLLILIIGAAAGFLATRFMRVQLDVVTTVLLGMAGAAVSWMVLRLVARIMGSGLMFIGAILGAMALIWLWKTTFRR